MIFVYNSDIKETEDMAISCQIHLPLWGRWPSVARSDEVLDGFISRLSM